MTDARDTIKSRTLWSRDGLKRAAGFAPALRFVPKNPLLLIGAAVVGVAGVLAWRNRERIARTAGPMIADARTKGQALLDDAKVKGQALADEAAARTQALGEKISRRAPEQPREPFTPDLH